MSIRKHRIAAASLEPVAGNGLLDRRALLRGGAVVAGAMTTGAAPTGAAAEPLQNDAWSLEMGSVVPAYQVPSRFEKGENGVKPAPGFLPMVGPSKFDRIDTMKTVPYYKYATTLFDVMRRSMPYSTPKTLTGDELYALSAYILALNKIIGEDEVMDAKSLPQVKMPNRDNFIIWDPDKIGYEPIPMPRPAMR